MIFSGRSLLFARHISSSPARSSDEDLAIKTKFLRFDVQKSTNYRGEEEEEEEEGALRLSIRWSGISA